MAPMEILDLTLLLLAMLLEIPLLPLLSLLKPKLLLIDLALMELLTSLDQELEKPPILPVETPPMELLELLESQEALVHLKLELLMVVLMELHQEISGLPLETMDLAQEPTQLQELQELQPELLMEAHQESNTLALQELAHQVLVVQAAQSVELEIPLELHILPTLPTTIGND